MIGFVLWGPKYVKNFLEYFLASALAPQNLPALGGKTFISIVTNTEGQSLISQHPVFSEIQKYAQIEFFIFDDCLISHLNYLRPDNLFYRIYGALDHTNYFFAREMNSDLFLLPVDSILANGTLANMKRLIGLNYDCCGSANLVAKLETFLPALDKMKSGLTLDIATEDLATLAFQHMHQYLESQLMTHDNRNFGRWPRELFWLEENSVVAHSMYIHPLALSRRIFKKDVVLTYNNVDADFVARVFNTPQDFARVRVLSAKEDGAYINNFAPDGRRFETTGTVFSDTSFLTAHLFSQPVHRFFFTQKQVIPYRSQHKSTPSSQDVGRIQGTLKRHFENQRETNHV